MAEVYLGVHTTLNRPVAVKILHGHLSGDPSLLQRFRAEAQAVAGLRHPNIVRILDFDVADGSPYMVMELVEGMSLGDYLQGLHGLGTILPLEAVAKLALPIGSALDYAHAQGIIHRDVKPANVMLRAGAAPIHPGLPLQPDVEPILTDFGVARIAGGITQTASGTILGTPAYMSPEQIRGLPVDARSDVYSLGIIVYEMLAGKLPFDGETETPASILMKHLNEPPPPLADTSQPIREIVERALAKDRDHRYQRAGDFCRDLARAVGLALPTETPAHVSKPIPAPKRPSPRPLRRRVSLGLGIGAGVVVLAGFALTAWPLGGASPSPTPTEPAGLAGIAPTPATSVAQPPDASPTAPAAAPIGVALFHDGTLHVDLQDLPAAGPGHAYEGWLESAGAPPIPLGALAAAGSFDYADPQGATLLLDHDGFVISLEPDPDPDAAGQDTVAFTAIAGDDALSLIRFLHEITPDSPPSTAVLAGLEAQVHHFSSHLNLMLTAISQDDLAGAKSHAEHVINILEGERGADFGDWNGDGLVQNPGDAFGLLPYLRLLALFAAPPGPASPTPDPASPGALLATRLDGLISDAVEIRGLVTRIATADLITEVEPLTPQVTSIPVEEGVLEALILARDLDLSIQVPLIPASP
jgi:serine/threonine-protein kinase